MDSPSNRLPILAAKAITLLLLSWTSIAALICPTASITLPTSAVLLGQESDAPHRLPNIVLINIDDLGYGDIRPFSNPTYPTPNLDRLQREGRVFADFSVSSAVCSSSRVALLTGCYHTRVGIHGALGPRAKTGIAASETTLGELCKTRGYATACIGKWHLGDAHQFLPLQNGFDEYYGLPYSNDMWPRHPDPSKLPKETAKRKSGYPPLPLFEGNQIVDEEVTAEDQMRLTTDYTRKAVDFIERHSDQPFLLYLPHAMVHVPLFVLPENDGRTGQGLFADVMHEVDWSVGQILDALDRLKLSENTLVIFTSDNGPWLPYGNHAGNAGPLREGKGTSFEGGVRVPTLMRWTGKIPAGTRCDEFASTIDIFPTIAKLIDAKLPKLPIDGLDISQLMFDANPGPSPHEHFFIYYSGGQLQAVRDRQYKLLLPHRYGSLEGKPGGTDGNPAANRQFECPLSLYDLKADPGETKNLVDSHPEVVGRLQAAAEDARRRFGDTLTKREGSENRNPGKLEETEPR